MKFYKLLAGFGLAVLASVSVNTSAQASECTWSSVYGYSGGGYSYISLICRNSSSAVLASRTDTYSIAQGNIAAAQQVLPAATKAPTQIRVQVIQQNAITT